MARLRPLESSRPSTSPSAQGRLDIAIVGAGTAGAAASVLLARAGHRVTLYERVPTPAPVGAGIIMQPSGLEVLRVLGIADRIVAHGAALERLRCVTANGRTLLDLPYAEVGARGGIGLHRGVLFAELHRLLGESRVTLECGREIAQLRPAGDGVIPVDAAGRALPRADLCIVADGARSRLRDETDPALGRRSVRVYPWGALWFIGRDPERKFAAELHQVVDGASLMIGVLPTGRGPAPSDDTPLASLFFSIRADRVRGWRANGLYAWKQKLLGYVPEAAELIDQIRTLDDVTFAAYHDIVLSPWHTRNTVWLGDAAHATSPQLGQGCNLALVDAHTLAQCLAAHEDVPSALAAYSQRRRRQLAYYQLATRWLTPLFQSDAWLGGALRDVAMPIGARLPWVKRQMLLTMCGLKTGLFSSLPMPEIARG